MAAWPTLADPDVVRQRYQAALARVVADLRRDPYVLAAILAGSLSHDQVWEKSDIDLILVGRDERVPSRYYTLVEDGINIHATMYSRSRFRKELEGTLTGAFFHSYFAKSTLLFSTDESIQTYYDDARGLGSSDRAHQLLLRAAQATSILTKAQKWLYVKHDTAYCFLWYLLLVNQLATIETLLGGEVPGREVLQQAMRYNPDLFQRIYFAVIDRQKTPELLHELLVEVEQYLVERIDQLFQPLLDYLADAGGPRTVTEIESHFKHLAPTDHDGAGLACEWLETQGLLHKIPMPLRLTEKSPATVTEAAYVASHTAP